jgi:hypothetical protein
MKGFDGRHKGCSGCAWNDGIARLKNEFGFLEGWRACAYFGYKKLLGLPGERAARCEFWRRDRLKAA